MRMKIGIFFLIFAVCLELSCGRARAEVYGLMHLDPGPGYQNREAELIDISLQQRSDGSLPIDGPYTATPRELLLSFRQYSPNLTLSTLSQYVRSLLPGFATPGKYDTAYIESSPYGIRLHGWPMVLTAETQVLYDGSQMVQIEGGGGVVKCGNILYKPHLRTIARVRAVPKPIRVAVSTPTPTPTAPPVQVSMLNRRCVVDIALKPGAPSNTVWIEVYRDGQLRDRWIREINPAIEVAPHKYKVTTQEILDCRIFRDVRNLLYICYDPAVGGNHNRFPIDMVAAREAIEQSLPGETVVVDQHKIPVFPEPSFVAQPGYSYPYRNGYPGGYMPAQRPVVIVRPPNPLEQAGAMLLGALAHRVLNPCRTVTQYGPYGPRSYTYCP